MSKVSRKIWNRMRERRIYFILLAKIILLVSLVKCNVGKAFFKNKVGTDLHQEHTNQTDWFFYDRFLCAHSKMHKYFFYHGGCL